MSGGEPLSPEQESTLQETWNRVLAWREQNPSEPSLKAILLAFAREILQSTEKALEQSIAQRVDLLRAADRQGAALLASQERCKALSEAGERHMITHGCSIVDANSLTCRDCDELRAALSAYRSSEAGGTKEKLACGRHGAHCHGDGSGSVVDPDSVCPSWKV